MGCATGEPCHAQHMHWLETDGKGLDRCSPVASSSATSGAGAPGARCAELRHACAARAARSEVVSGRYETRTWAVRGP